MSGGAPAINAGTSAGGTASQQTPGMAAVNSLGHPMPADSPVNGPVQIPGQPTGSGSNPYLGSTMGANPDNPYLGPGGGYGSKGAHNGLPMSPSAGYPNMGTAYPQYPQLGYQAYPPPLSGGMFNQMTQMEAGPQYQPNMGPNLGTPSRIGSGMPYQPQPGAPVAYGGPRLAIGRHFRAR